MVSKAEMTSDSSIQAAAKREIDAALSDPNLTEEGFETSKIIALIAVLLKGQDKAGSQERLIPSRKRLVRLMKTCYQFVITNSDGRQVIWYADMKKKGRVGKGKPPMKPDVTIWCSDRDLVALATGEANPQKLFAAGRIKIRGNIDRALKVEHILSHEREKIKLAGDNAPSPVDSFMSGSTLDSTTSLKSIRSKL